jgi:iron(III) transport system substrate-binding protein
MTTSVRFRSTAFRIAFVLVATAAASTVQAQAAAGGKTSITVYTSLQKEVLSAYEDAFHKVYPEIQIGWVRDAGGVIHARLLAERDNPRADVIFGLPVTDILSLEKEGLIERYAPIGFEALKPKFRDGNNPPIWTGIDMYLNVICFNTVEAQKRNLPKPQHWSDLTKPIYKGQISMPNPAASNTGYGYVHSWVQTMGEQQAWTFMDGLHANIGVYTNSSATPCKLAATGEYAIGLSTDLTAPLMKTKGAPIEIIIPVDKTAWDIEAKAMLKGTRNRDAAKKLLDWGTSKAANEEFIKYIGSVGLAGLTNVPPPNSVIGGDAMAADLDLQFSIDNRSRLIAEWSKRYSSKSEAK